MADAKERKPRRPKEEILKVKIATATEKLEKAKANVERFEALKAKLENDLANLEHAAENKVRAAEDRKKINALIKEKGLTFDQLEALLDNK